MNSAPAAGWRPAWALGDALAGLAVGGSRHAAARDGTMLLSRYLEQERPGAETALAALRSAFLNGVSGDGTRSATEAEGEWERMVNGATDKVDASPSNKRISRARGARHDDQQHEETGAAADPTPSPDGWHLTEHGNAQRFAAANRDPAPVRRHLEPVAHLGHHAVRR